MRLVLVHPRIPQNAGAVARLAAATRTPLILVRPLGFRLAGAAVRRAALDYWEAADVRTAVNLEEALEEAAGEIYWFSAHGRRSYLDVRYYPQDTLVFGSEDQGLPQEALLSAPPDRILRIPIANPAVRSLNLAASVAVALYEALRQIERRALDGG